jgi:hypothetical protein
LLLSIFALGAPSRARAEIVTIAFSGEVLANGLFLPGSSLIVPGDPVSGFFTYDTSSPDTNPAANAGSYAGEFGVFSLNIADEKHFNPFNFGDSPLTIIVLNDFFLSPLGLRDSLRVTGTSGAPSPESASLLFNDFTAAEFSSDDLPPLPLDLSGFTSSGNYEHYGSSGLIMRVNFTIDTMTAVPEPSAAALLSGVAVAGMALLRASRTDSRR